jgi:hypothetical protein
MDYVENKSFWYQDKGKVVDSTLRDASFVIRLLSSVNNLKRLSLSKLVSRLVY